MRLQQARQREFFLRVRRAVRRRKEEEGKTVHAQLYARSVAAQRVLRAWQFVARAGRTRIKRLSHAYCNQRVMMCAFTRLKEFLHAR